MPNQSLNPDPLLNGKEAADYLHTTHKTLANLRCRGEGPRYIKMRGKILYRQSALDEYIAKFEGEAA